MPENALFAPHTFEKEPDLFRFDNPLWARCETAAIDRYRTGKSAIRQHGVRWQSLTHVRSAWNEQFLYLYFEAWFQPSRGPAANPDPDEAVGFLLRPGRADNYFQVQVGPGGQTQSTNVLRPGSAVEFDWGPKFALSIGTDGEKLIWRTFLGLPYSAMAVSAPEPETAWRLNLFRLAGRGGVQESLAWRPTFTESPGFHVPSACGHLFFLEP